MQEFIKYKYKESTIDIPFRSMLFRSYLASLNLDTIIFDKSFIIKEAKCLNITDVDDFLKIFTDFGSILYIPQFESLKKFVIIDVWKFTEYLNKLYYPNLSEPHAEDLSVYGIVSEQSVRDVLFPEKNVSHFMQILTEFGMAATLYSGSSIILEHKALDSDQRYYFLPIARVSSPKSIPLHEDDYVFFEIDNIASPPDVLAGITEELMKNKEVFMLGTTEHNVSLFEFRSKESHLKMEIVCEGDKIKLKVKDIQEDTFSSAVQVCKKFLKASVSFFKRYNNIILNFKYTFAIPCSPVFERYHYYDEGEHYHRKESMLCSHCSNSQDTYKKCWNDAAQKCQYLKHEGYKRSQDVTRLQLENMQFCDTNEELKRQIEDMGKQLEDKDRHIARLTKRSGDQTHDKAYFDFDKASDIDNLKGCQILEKESFLVEGGKCQSINWQKYGLSIDLQEESFLPSTTAKVAVNVFIGGSFVFPKNFVLVSAVYAVSVSKSLFKSFMSLSLQHCIDLKAYPTLTECLEFATVPITTPTPNSIPYKFSIMKGGDFSDSSYGVINQDELCFLVCIVGYSEASLSNGGNGENGGGVNEGSEDEEDIANDDDDCFMEDDGGGQSREQRGNEDSDSSITTGSSSSHADPISDDSSIRSKSPGEKKHHHDDKKHAAASIEKAKRYIIAMFGEECENLVIFAATKRLNALIEHIKKYHNAKKELQHVPFQFEKDKNYIELIFDSKQEPQYTKEWVVSPLMKPCKFFQQDINDFGEKKYSHPPYCLVHADPSCDAVPVLRYSVPVENVTEPFSLLIHKKRDNILTVQQRKKKELATCESVSEAGPSEEKDDHVNQVRNEIKKILRKHRMNLKDASGYSLSRIADKLYVFKIISGTVHKSPEFDHIIDLFIICLNICSTKINLLETCEKFLIGFSCDCGPSETISNCIRKDVEEIIFEEGDKWPQVQ